MHGAGKVQNREKAVARDKKYPYNLSSQAGIAQLVEHNLAKVGVASSSLVSRSGTKQKASVSTGAFSFPENPHQHAEPG